MKNNTHHKTIRSFVTIFVIFSSLLLFSAQQTHATPIDPQYIFVRKDGSSCNPSDCSQFWSFNNPDKINQAAIDDVLNKIGTRGNNNNTRKIGIGVLIHYNRHNLNNILASIDKLLPLATENQIPLFIVLDGFQYLNKAPELWNWWDQDQPGYDLKNRSNVEWTCSNGSSCATKTAWRNWASEISLAFPHPNLASPTFIQANKNKLNTMLPKISSWYQSLPQDKKWLLGGISLGLEVNIGGNYYHYSNGINPNAPNPGPGNSQSDQLGYAAIQFLGLEGGITSANLDKVVQNYYTELNKYAYQLGIPRQKIFDHVNSPGFTLPNHIITTPESSLSPYGNPAWSFYNGDAANPQQFDTLHTIFQQQGYIEWGAAEWRAPNTTYSSWYQAFQNNFNFGNTRFINISNWERIRSEPEILKAIKTIANEEPTCWVTKPQINITTDKKSVSFKINPGNNNQKTRLHISSSSEYRENGLLQNIDIVNVPLNPNSTYSKPNLSDGQYYWNIVTTGCTNQRRITAGTFKIASQSLPGDLNGDGSVNIFDYNILVAGFGTKYDIFDYNNLITNYGQ